MYSIFGALTFAVLNVEIAAWFHDYVPTWDIYFNKEVWKKIPPDLQEILKGATMATAFRHGLRFNRQNAESLEELKKLGVTVTKTPDDINLKFLEAWEKVAAREAAKHPLVKKVLDSQKKYATLVQTYRLSVNPPYEFAARYFLRKK
jgi:TRAP-type mannitol/chloroaromatic compound transport system substrate-binding protein